MTPGAAHRECAAVQVQQAAVRIGAGGKHPFAGHPVGISGADVDVAEVRAITEPVQSLAHEPQPLARGDAALRGGLECVQQLERFVMPGTRVARRGVLDVPGLVVPAQVPAAQRETFLLQAEGGLSLAEIATATDVPVETAKSRLRYARATLRQTLEGLL